MALLGTITVALVRRVTMSPLRELAAREVSPGPHRDTVFLFSRTFPKQVLSS